VAAVGVEAVRAEGVAGAAEAEEVALVLAQLRVLPARHEEARAQQRPQPRRAQVLLRPHHRARARHAHHNLQRISTHEHKSIAHHIYLSSPPNKMQVYTYTFRYCSTQFAMSTHTNQYTHARAWKTDIRREDFYLPLV
jgi:hypothetical protein